MTSAKPTVIPNPSIFKVTIVSETTGFESMVVQVTIISETTGFESMVVQWMVKEVRNISNIV